jgi:hypothetical protein
MYSKPLSVDVVFATPGNNLTSGYVKSLLATISELHRENMSWIFLNQGGSLISMIREMTIAGPDVNELSLAAPFRGEFLYKKIMWIDSDIIWHPSDFFRIYNSEKDIVSGCYLMPSREIPIYNQPRGGMMPEKLLDDYDEPFKVAGCGFGFLGVKFGVFEKMPRPWFGPVAVTDSEGGESFPLLGEDLAWCTKAITEGFDIWVDPSVKVSHIKTGVIQFD